MFKKKSRKTTKIVKIQTVIIIVFLAVFILINVVSYFDLIPKASYYKEGEESTYPILYQERNGKLTNELRGFVDENYKLVANDTTTFLYDQRRLDLLMFKNGHILQEIEYEVREQTTNQLIERTRLPVPQNMEDEVRMTAYIQNLIKENTMYMLLIKINLGDKTINYFTNIIYRPRNRIDEALNLVEDFTSRTFNEASASQIVKYLETSINKDQKEMYKIDIASSFEQITWAGTKMELASEYFFEILQAQEYCYNINVSYLTTSNINREKQTFINKDKYVLRIDTNRHYYMKFERETEELVNLDEDPYDGQKKRFYLGVTNPEKIKKIESENKEYFAFCKEKEIYLYDAKENIMRLIFSNRIKNAKSFKTVPRNYNVKLLMVTDDGTVNFITYGYNMNGENEGYMGIGNYTYNIEENIVRENLFIPVYSSYQSLKYDLEKYCCLNKGRLIFKSYSRIYAIDISTAESMILADGFDETRFAASKDGKYFAFNNDINGKNKTIIIYNIADGLVNTIEAYEGENIEVITYMNDDLFYGILSEKNVWIEADKIIGRPSHEIKVVNSKTNEEKSFREANNYFYNFVNEENVLRFNKYKREGTHYIFSTRDVIVNNYSEEEEIQYAYGEEFTKEKLRVGYITIEQKQKHIKYEANSGIVRRKIEDMQIRASRTTEENIFYVYDSGELVNKLKVFSDAVDEIRDKYGYVKLNDKFTCYNRANKGNVSYLRQKDSILENLKYFKEDLCLINDSIMVINVTGVTERDLEYYITLEEKVAVFKNDTFQFFITGYDNNNFVLEYPNKDRILTPRDVVHRILTYEGFITFAQLENLE